MWWALITMPPPRNTISLSCIGRTLYFPHHDLDTSKAKIGFLVCTISRF